mgnify:FL=1
MMMKGHKRKMMYQEDPYGGPMEGAAPIPADMPADMPAPQAAAAPSPDDLMAQAEQEQAAKAQAIAAALPEVEEALEVKLLTSIVDKLNELAVMGVGEGMAQPLVYEETEKKVQELPLEVAVPLLMAMGAIAEIGAASGIDVSKYAIDPQDLGSNAGLRKAAGLIDMLMKDDALLAALGPQDATLEGEEMAEAPPVEMADEFNEEDEALMDMM